MSMQATTEPATILPVALGDRSYDIVMGPDLLVRAGELLGPVLRRPELVIVTDAHLVSTPHLGRLGRGLAAAGIAYRTVIVPPGEATKSMTELERLLEAVLEGGAERSLTILALGGGVVGDLAGFASAVLLRGLDFIQVPTTLLSQVDSSVGGKTGVNSAFGKNLIGAFHQPRRVLIDTTVLQTLPPRELRSGYAELVKHAFIRDLGLFDWLEQHAADVLRGSDPSLMVEAIGRSVAVKAAIVAADERETGDQRALLNFGHTFAHAYEKLTGYGDRLLHGEAVALGMAHAYALSVRLGRCPVQDAQRAVAHLARAGLPTRFAQFRNERFDPVAVLDVMKRDKKVQDGRLTFVLTRGIGEAHVARDVPEEAVRALLSGDE